MNNTLIRALLAVVALAALPASEIAFAQAIDVTSLAALQGPEREKRLVDGARREGEVNVYTSLVVEDIQNLAVAFEKKYGVKVKHWRASSEKVVQRIVTETRANRYDYDVVETNGPELEALYREKLLAPASSPHDSDLIPAAVRPHKAWVGTRLNMFVQAYNTSLVKSENLPKSYSDLLDPRWKGRLGIEAEDVDWFGAVVKELGEEKGLKLFRDIAATNGFSVRKGHTLLAGLVASGEVPFALTVYNHNAERLKKKGAPIDWYAIAPAFVRPNGMALSKKPAHPHAAVLFYDFMLSEEGQRILEKGNYVPASTKLNNPAQKLKLQFIDPAMVLDEAAKWEKLWDEIIVKQSKS
ncbi:MAG: extracellular solute-binding protein [Casimicrobiaceae bacterium]